MRFESDCYVIQVYTGHEKLICSKINDSISSELFNKCFVPMMEYVYRRKGEIWRECKIMFPGYVFVLTDSVNEFASKLRCIDGMTKLLTSGEMPISISEEEKTAIFGLIDEDNIAKLSEGYIEQDKIYVTSGPLVGQEGVIKKIDRHKRIAYIELSIMGRVSQVRMPLEIVKKV